MLEKKREIFIKVDKVHDIVDTLYEIKVLEEEIKKLFREYDGLNYKENALFENWVNYLDDANHKLDHLVL